MRPPRPGRALAWSVAGVLAYLVALLLTAPATLLWSLAGAAAPPAAAVSGSLWSGQAEGLVIGRARLERVTWSLAALPLLLGRAGGEVQVVQADLALRAHWSAQRDGSVTLDALAFAAGLDTLAALAGQTPGPLTGRLQVEPGARVELRGGRLVAWACTGGLHDLAARAMPTLALGALSLRCEMTAGGPRAHLEDQGGPLAVQGQLLVAPDGRWSLDARIGARPDTPAGLRAALPLLGAADGPDRIRLRLAGTLPQS